MTKQTKAPEVEIEKEVKEILDLEKSIADQEAELMQNEKFRSFLTAQKLAKEKIDIVWSTIENEMIAHNVKSLKGEWGSITIAERLDFKVDMDDLPAKFIKKTADKKRIRDYFHLEGKVPRGAEPVRSKYLTKRIK